MHSVFYPTKESDLYIERSIFGFIAVKGVDCGNKSWEPSQFIKTEEFNRMSFKSYKEWIEDWSYTVMVQSELSIGIICVLKDTESGSRRMIHCQGSPIPSSEPIVHRVEMVLGNLEYEGEVP